jgi:hypothetical protein
MSDETPSVPQYDFSLTGDGISITRKVSEPVARSIIALVLGGTITPAREISFAQPPNAGGAAPSSRQASERLSLREYLDDVGATRNPDKITAIGQFMLEQEARDLFTRDDVKSRFRSAGEAAPGNFPRDFSLAVRTGWISEDPKSPGSFYVTKKGREALQGGFVAEVKRPGSKRRRKDGGASDPIDDFEE